MNQCSKQVWDRFHRHPCSRTGTVQRDGKWYCGQHDPEKVAAKRDVKIQERKLREDRQAEAKVEAHRLIDALGVQGRVDYQPYRSALQPGGITRNIVLSFEEAEKIISRIKYAERKAGLR